MTTSTRREAPLWAFPVFGYVRGFACCRKCAPVSHPVRSGACGHAPLRALTAALCRPTLPLHRPCGRSPSPWQGRFCPGPSFRPAPHPPAMHPVGAAIGRPRQGPPKQNTPMRIRTRLGFHEFASACCIFGEYTADERCRTVRWTVLYCIPRLRRLWRRNRDPQPSPLHENT